ncbi:ligase-associated DNA damage response endonuclease PdeM [Cupriavidus sp. P-10]|uniref:ligase-associated DNA damage response endonuclease PdeM n=1 Tax=Cupriavidus sp. P-10 TaxID=2027911 RepID=UPI000E2EA0A8|nr:ligase-associated DNA damage response endonuclease PdeM [Cupriavidus sp. P-10]BDB28000.1 ligase-associated DNA damage response endonuclease PdeM [Cupriavidus sp. P-10]
MTPDAGTLRAHGACAVSAAGETLWLLPEHAVWWPAAGMLMVADVHFGKAAAFRALGQPVPHGTTGDNLGLLTQLTRQLPVEELVFLGDFLHARAARTPAVLAALDGWRRSLPPQVRCTLVRGNHDARAGDPPDSLQIRVVTEPAVASPLALCHLPGASPLGYVLAGHLHPACRLRGAGADSLRLPCFLFGPRGAILPAFGAFTGHATVRPQADERVYVAGGGRVWPVGRAPQSSPQNSV